MKVVDLKIQIDGLLLKDDETVEDYIKKIREITETSYEILYEVIYEEKEE